MLVHPMRAWVSVTSRKQHWDNDNNVLVFFAIIVIKKKYPNKSNTGEKKLFVSFIALFKGQRGLAEDTIFLDEEL